MRCDFAAVAGVALAAVRIPGGAQINVNSTTADLAAAIAVANANAGSCAVNSRQLAAEVSGAAAAPRAAQSLVVTLPWATVAVNIGAVTSAAGAAAIVANILAATAAAYPRTTAAWAPVWGYLPAAWVLAIGSPLALVANSLKSSNAASYSPAPKVPGLTQEQQLGLGLGIGISLALIFCLGACCAWGALLRRQGSRAAVQLHVVAPKASDV